MPAQQTKKFIIITTDLCVQGSSIARHRRKPPKLFTEPLYLRRPFAMNPRAFAVNHHGLLLGYTQQILQLIHLNETCVLRATC
jgi:hypothetical protein